MQAGNPSPSGDRFLIAGLGNPGEKYRATRHNVGFDILDRLAARASTAFASKSGWQADIAEAMIGDRKVTLLKPLTFMNLSGESVKAATGWYKIPPSQVLVILDDTALGFGVLRLRGDGSAGGHNGLQSVIDHLGTPAVPRLRVGVGAKAHPGMDLADHVLGKFSREETELLDQEILNRAAQAAEAWLLKGLQKAMNEFNQKNTKE